MMKRTAAVLVVALGLAGAIVACSSSSSTTPAAAGTTDASTDTGSVTPDAAEATYPAGPYGIGVGDVFPSVTWQGERGGQAPLVSISSSDYYDPTGAKGIRSLYFTITASCGSSCTMAATTTAAASAGPPYDFAKRGGRAVDMLALSWASDPIQPVKVSDVDGWARSNKITYDVVIEPSPASDGGGFTTGIGSVDGVPYSILVDPRTMQVTAVFDGYDPKGSNLGAIDALLVANGAPEVTIPDAGAD
jgi:hypothetical protein